MAQPTSWLSKVLAVVVVALIVMVAYVFKMATSKSDNESYKGNASKSETTVTVAPTEYQLVRCGQLFTVDPKLLAQQGQPGAVKK
jgi:hypothetical protein